LLYRNIPGRRAGQLSVIHQGQERAKCTRRDFLAAIAAGAGFALLPAKAGSAPRMLRAREARAALAGAAHPQTSVWGYEGAVPGPRTRGDRVRRGQSRQLDVPLPRPGAPGERHDGRDPSRVMAAPRSIVAALALALSACGEAPALGALAHIVKVRLPKRSSP
jgi:hypothetical protein